MVGSKIIKDNTVKVAGNKYKFFKSRDIEGKIKLLTVKRDTCGDFYVYLVCETPEVNIEPRLGKSIGFDFGLKGKMLVAPIKRMMLMLLSSSRRNRKLLPKPIEISLQKDFVQTIAVRRSLLWLDFIAR